MTRINSFYTGHKIKIKIKKIRLKYHKSIDIAINLWYFILDGFSIVVSLSCKNYGR